MVNVLNIKLFKFQHLIYLKDFWIISCFYHISFLRYFWNLKLTSRIPMSMQNLLKSISSYFLVETWYQHEILTSCLLLQDETTGDSILIYNVIVLNGMPKFEKLFWTFLACRNKWIFDFHENGGKRHKSPIFLLVESESWNEKSCFYLEIWFLENVLKF